MNKDAMQVILREEGLLNGMTRPGNRATERQISRKTAKGEETMEKKFESAVEKNWENTIVKVSGLFKTDENGKIVFTARQFDKTTKYTATLQIGVNSPRATLRRENNRVFVDGLRKADVDAFRELEEKGEINSSTCWIIEGHLVKNEGKPGMNDMYNLKTLSIDEANGEKPVAINLDEALTKEEWQVIYKARKAERAAASAKAAPVAPSAPVAPGC